MTFSSAIIRTINLIENCIKGIFDRYFNDHDLKNLELCGIFVCDLIMTKLAVKALKHLI